MHETSLNSTSGPHPDPSGPRLAAVAAAILAAVLNGAAPAPGRAAAPSDSAAVILWEAPGDDGATGRAARYEMRYRPAPIAGTDTLSWWSVATPATAMPAPAEPGATDSVVVRGLDPYLAYYFVLRAADEVPNWSGFSNVVVKPPVLDVWPPAQIVDLRAD